MHEHMIPVVSKPAPQINEAEVISTFKQTSKTLDDFYAIMPEKLKVEVEKGVYLLKFLKSMMIA